MDKILPWVAVIFLLAVAIFFYSKKKQQDVIKPFDDCTSKNKALPEGSSCTSCVPEGSSDTPFSGTIVNGVCTQIQPPPPPPQDLSTLKVSNPSGARVHSYYGGQNKNIFVPQNKWIPFGTKTTYTQTISTPTATYYSTPYGWLPASDMAILKIEDL